MGELLFKALQSSEIGNNKMRESNLEKFFTRTGLTVKAIDILSCEASFWHGESTV